MGSVALRSGDSLTIPRMAWSVGFLRFVSSAEATQATGSLTVAPVGLFPTEHVSLYWTHSSAITSAQSRRTLLKAVLMVETAEDRLRHAPRVPREPMAGDRRYGKLGRGLRQARAEGRVRAAPVIMESPGA